MRHRMKKVENKLMLNPTQLIAGFKKNPLCSLFLSLMSLPVQLFRLTCRLLRMMSSKKTDSGVKSKSEAVNCDPRSKQTNSYQIY